MTAEEDDPFNDLLSLEDQFYTEGYDLGLLDGGKAGQIEGRIFGLEKGFEKYVEMGRLHGRSLIWNSRHPLLQPHIQKYTPETKQSPKSEMESGSEHEEKDRKLVDDLPENKRLEKHLRVLYALTESASLSTENTEESVSDFDDRFKRAIGKIKIVERLVGEVPLSEGSVGGIKVGGSEGQNIEDVDILKARH